MSFTSAQPRHSDGKFGEKTGGAPEVGLQPDGPVTATIRIDMFDESGEYGGYDETSAFDIESVLDGWELDKVEAMREDQSYGRLHGAIKKEGLTDSFFAGRGQVRVSDAAIDAYIAGRKAREARKESRTTMFGNIHSLDMVYSDYSARVSGRARSSNEERDRELKRLAGAFVTRTAELADDENYERAVRFAVGGTHGDESLHVGRSRVTRTDATHPRFAPPVAKYRGGRPTIEVAEDSTIVLDRTDLAVVNIRDGVEANIVVSDGSTASILFHKGATGKVISRSEHTDVLGQPGVETVGVTKPEAWTGAHQGADRR